MQVSTCNVTIQQNTVKEFVACLYKNTFLTCYSNWAPHVKKPQLSPHKFKTVNYGSRIQMAQEADASKPLNESGIPRVQQVLGALLWVGQAVNNKLLVALSAIGSQQASAT